MKKEFLIIGCLIIFFIVAIMGCENSVEKPTLSNEEKVHIFFTDPKYIPVIKKIRDEQLRQWIAEGRNEQKETK